ncbi:response regulator transcription factor [Zavarzinella formosa]|uniref:response regulator transcription factor n=1 Tax=Zavarzinella formosa TaxID=360055 RepID=UPI0004982337|nr:response regulator transcription factor [Zavarzinella formosa]
MRMLVVEDEPELRRVLAQALREEGYAVDEAGDGPDGLYKANAWDYDAILLDMMLPGLNGWEVLTQLRKKKTTPVLVLTARDAITDRIRGLDVGADDYVVKPFNLAEVLARVRALIRRSAGRGDSKIEMGDVIIDTARRTVTQAGLAIVLTAREYAILEMLASRRGEVVTKTQIYDHIFDETDDSLSNLVEVHVMNIRKKLGRDFIATRRGQGYVVDG